MEQFDSRLTSAIGLNKNLLQFIQLEQVFELAILFILLFFRIYIISSGTSARGHH